jgi:phage terminase small subunit
MYGPTPKPTAIKILEGAQKCRTNFHEPAMPPVSSLRAPSWLGPVARKHWNELAPLLDRVGVLKETDRHALALLCDAYQALVSDAKDYKARDLYRRLACEFGLTPSSRSRLKAPTEPPKDALDQFLTVARSGRE